MARQTAPAAVAFLAAAAAALWLWLTVAANFSGDPSALFYTGQTVQAPTGLSDERIYRFPNSGYDGQFYHFVAHDPWLRRGFESSVDNPRLRWRRILIPGLAWLSSGGSDEYVDSVYWVITVLFAAVGAFWAATLLQGAGWSPWLGILFLLVPATAISLERMTVDVGLAALTLGCIVYQLRERKLALGLCLAVAPLARETGVILAFAVAISRRSYLALLWLMPALLWWAYVHAHTGPDLTGWTTPVPFLGMIARLFEPVQFELTSTWLKVAAALDYLALWGVFSAIALAIHLFMKQVRGSDREMALAVWIAILFAAAAALLSKKDVWEQAYSFTRIFSPMFLAMAVIAGYRRDWKLLIPLALSVPRILWQFGPQAKGILHFFFGTKP